MKPLWSLVVLVLFAGCDDTTKHRLATLDARIQRLENKTAVAPLAPTNGYLVLSDAEVFSESMAERLTGLSNRVEWLETQDWKRTMQSWEEAPRKWVTLDPTSKSYLRTDNQILPLLVAVEEFNSYLDGYRMKLKLGNPHAVTFSGVQLHAKWGPAWSTNNASVYDSLQKSNSFRVTATLPVGHWTEVEVTLAPCTAEETRHVRVSIVPDELVLYDKTVKK